MTDLDCSAFANLTRSEPSSTDPIFLLGILAIVAASAGSSLGIILQKRAHNAEREKSEEERSRHFLGIPLNLQWLLGFVLFAIWPLPFEFLALSIAPQSLIVPFGGLTIVFNQLLAPRLLPETLTKTEVISAAVIVVGLVLLAVGVAGNTNDLYDTPCEIFLRYTEVEVIIQVLVLIGLIVGSYAVIYHSDLALASTPFLFAFMAAGVNTLLQTIYKALAIMTEAEFSGRASAYTTIYPYVHAIAVLILAVAVASFINKGLARYETIVFQPIYICTLIVLSSTFGSLFWEEYLLYEAYNYALWILGKT